MQVRSVTMSMSMPFFSTLRKEAVGHSSIPRPRSPTPGTTGYQDAWQLTVGRDELRESVGSARNHTVPPGTLRQANLRRSNEDAMTLKLAVDTCVWLDLAKDYRLEPVVSALEDLIKGNYRLD